MTRPKPKPCNCAVCGTLFKPRHSLIVTCSPECRRVRTNAKHKVWRDANPEKVSGWKARWSANNAEHHRAVVRDWERRERAAGRRLERRHRK